MDLLHIPCKFFFRTFGDEYKYRSYTDFEWVITTNLLHDLTPRVLGEAGYVYPMFDAYMNGDYPLYTMATSLNPNGCNVVVADKTLVEVYYSGAGAVNQIGPAYVEYPEQFEIDETYFENFAVGNSRGVNAWLRCPAYQLTGLPDPPDELDPNGEKLFFLIRLSRPEFKDTYPFPGTTVDFVPLYIHQDGDAQTAEITNSTEYAYNDASATKVHLKLSDNNAPLVVFDEADVPLVTDSATTSGDGDFNGLITETVSHLQPAYTHDFNDDIPDDNPREFLLTAQVFDSYNRRSISWSRVLTFPTAHTAPYKSTLDPHAVRYSSRPHPDNTTQTQILAHWNRTGAGEVRSALNGRGAVLYLRSGLPARCIKGTTYWETSYSLDCGANWIGTMATPFDIANTAGFPATIMDTLNNHLGARIRKDNGVVEFAYQPNGGAWGGLVTVGTAATGERSVSVIAEDVAGGGGILVETQSKQWRTYDYGETPFEEIV